MIRSPALPAYLLPFVVIPSPSQVHSQYFLLTQVYFLMCSSVIDFLEFSLLVLDSVWKSFSFSFPVGQSFHFLILFEQKYLTFMYLLSKVFLVTRGSSLEFLLFLLLAHLIWKSQNYILFDKSINSYWINSELSFSKF